MMNQSVIVSTSPTSSTTMRSADISDAPSTAARTSGGGIDSALSATDAKACVPLSAEDAWETDATFKRLSRTAKP